MENNLITIANVRGFIDENGVAMLNAEDVARGWGFTQFKNDIEYVRWETINGYLKGFGISQQVGKDDFLPENIVYRLGFKASNEKAQKFQAILADEVIPSIRKHGGYIAGQEKLSDDELLAKALLVAQNKIIERDKRIEEQKQQITLMQPKADFYDYAADSGSLTSVGDVCKILDMGIGRNRLYQLLRDKGILMNNNIPYQRYVDAGYFKVVEGQYMAGDNAVISKTTYVKQKGIDFIRKLLIKEGYQKKN